MLVMFLTSGCSLLTQKHAIENKNAAGELSIPPSLRTPSPTTSVTNRTIRQSTRHINKDYFIVVGTYSTQEQALDTFVRLSSIGLANAAMESRQTKQGQTLHMVRLGPFNNQDEIDKTKDTLTNDGLSQFKVVEN